jgi:hypothetical protein
MSKTPVNVTDSGQSTTAAASHKSGTALNSKNQIENEGLVARSLGISFSKSPFNPGLTDEQLICLPREEVVQLSGPEKQRRLRALIAADPLTLSSELRLERDRFLPKERKEMESPKILAFPTGLPA